MMLTVKTTASRDARAMISAQETIPGHWASSTALIASMKPNPLTVRLGVESLSAFPDVEFISTDPSQPYMYISVIKSVAKQINITLCKMGKKIVYPNKTIVEMHSQESSSKRRGIRNVVWNKILNNFFSVWTCIGIEVHLQLSLNRSNQSHKKQRKWKRNHSRAIHLYICGFFRRKCLFGRIMFTVWLCVVWCIETLKEVYIEHFVVVQIIK